MIEIFLGVKREGRVPDVVVVNKKATFNELYAYHFVIIKKDGTYKIFKDRFSHHYKNQPMTRTQAFARFREALSEVRGTSKNSFKK